MEMRATVYPTGGMKAMLIPNSAAGCGMSSVEGNAQTCPLPVFEQFQRLDRGLDALSKVTCALSDRLSAVCSTAPVESHKSAGVNVTFSSPLATSLMQKVDRLWEVVDQLESMKNRLEI